MRKYFTRLRSALVAVLLLLGLAICAIYNGSAAHAATLSLGISQEVYTGDQLSFSWNNSVGASTYNLIASMRPGMTNAFTVQQRIAGSSSSSTLSLDSSIGYRYFQLQAYDASGNRVATSNVVGAAKYPSGVVIRMETNASLTAQYAQYNDTCYNTPIWFIPNDSTTGAYHVATNFQLSEFLHNITVSDAVVDPIMVQHVQNIRSDWGGPLTITSGYRDPAHNALVSGSATCSSHTFGQAVDIAVSSYSEWTTLQGYANQENASYIEPWQSDQPHLHADWRSFYDNPPYTNW
ncbi:D-Ala-D-Ala carboxypeptidase family metallohydrolase [Dictyobacter aurantiacus]|uniref:Peptidase M15A C-terminal domain-containing protein n=1 Tax=Dictyobacter aurantiacus TaxID=1936993 RepID=A0A401Z966_9CHLR|nr:D-Ala-D-Ala carboxypeptidase family metallohydrolase [Dictyobacter aurantiacus]GCE03373.1 hypothetical protein KDAU_07020 [Dictyobacter aurantiacus]